MPDITIILPTWNEHECIDRSITKITSQLSKDNLSYEILVIDDNSTDGTQKIVNKLSESNPNIKLIERVPPNSFGYAIKEGLQLAKGKLSVVMMADLSDDPMFISKMWDRYEEGYDVIVGSRFLKNSKIYNYPFLKHIFNRLFNISVMLLFITNIRDTSNNFKAFNTKKVKYIPVVSKGFEVGSELMLRMLIKKANICEIPVTWTDRTHGTAKFKLRNTFINYFLLLLKMLKIAYFG